MPHQFMSIICKKCGNPYCPVCHEKCPKCGEVDIADENTMRIRKQMRRQTEKYKNNLALKEKINP